MVDQLLLLEPTLATILHLSQKLTHEQWEVRQVAACGLHTLLPILQAQSKTELRYAIISLDKQTQKNNV